MYYLAILLCSFLITFITIPSIIHVAQTRNLYDDLCHRLKSHPTGIPRLGGVGIFISFVITLLLCNINSPSLSFNALLIACVIIFAIGLKDDLAGVGHYAKFTVQFIAAAIIVCFNPAQFQSFHISALSIVFIIFLTNAFNLIDGIDGLAATIAILVNTAFSTLFIVFRQYELATVTIALTGAVLGFVRFNLRPASIFMGDTGSLLIGLISATMAIEFVKIFTHQPYLVSEKYSAIVLVAAILIVPVSDTIRVGIIRIYKGKSPFQGDSNHIHHRLLKLGFTHLQTTVILAIFNLILILLVSIWLVSNNHLLTPAQGSETRTPNLYLLHSPHQSFHDGG